MKITGLTVYDVRFPTSLSLDGSDAMHRSPDYSAAYVVLSTDDPELSGHGLTFTNGRGTEVCLAAIHALEPLVVGRSLEGITGDMRGFWRSLVSDDQLRWLGPEKGVMHLATAAIVNAVWDLWAKARARAALAAARAPLARGSRRGHRLPLHRDALTPDEALDLLRRRARERKSASCTSSARATPRTRPPPAGSATTTTRSRRSSGRPLRMDSPTSR